MTRCIFCEEVLTPETRPEHILLSCLGGRKETRRVDCSACNGRFGSTIDKEIAEQARVIRNMLKLESGMGKPAPGLMGIKAGNFVLNVDNDGIPSAVGTKPFTVTPLPDGSRNVQIHARDLDHLKKIIPQLAAAEKIPEQELIDLLKTGNATSVSQRPGTVHHQLSFGGEDAIRSMVKSALVLWALVVGNEEVRSLPYLEARSFVLVGGDFNVRRTHLDSRPLPGIDTFEKQHGPFFNLLYVASNEAGRVVAHFTLYNIIGWQMVLAETGGTSNRESGVINNPLNPKDWTDTVATDAPIPFAWLDDPDHTDMFKRAKQRFSAMLRKYTDDGYNFEWDKIIMEEFERGGIKEGDVLTNSDALREILNRIAERVSSHIAGVPHAKKITAEALEKLLKGK